MLDTLKKYPVKISELKNTSLDTQDILATAVKKGFKIFRYHPKNDLFFLKNKSRQAWYFNRRFLDKSRVGAVVTKDKQFTKELLESLNIPTPSGIIATKLSELAKVGKAVKYPLVVKPYNSTNGKAVFTNVKSKNVMTKAYKIARRCSSAAIIEEYVDGEYYRLLIIGKKFFAAAQAKGATVSGDGKKTVKDLIKEENLRLAKLSDHQHKSIALNSKAKRLLLAQELTSQSIPAKGRKVVLSFSGADGGEWIDVTDQIHANNKKIGEKIAVSLGLNVIGVDIICHDISRPLTRQNGVVIEVNSVPFLEIHQHPTIGKARDAASAIIKTFFAKN